MKKIFYSVLLLLLGFCVFSSFAQDLVIPKKRPREMWVFRSALDERARMVTVALNEKLWVAYDATNCGVYKVWDGNTKFEGTVYNTVHGPQPTTQGATYTKGMVDETVWILKNSNGQIEPTKTHFKGYVWKDNTVTFNYELVTEKGEIIAISEVPEYVENKKKERGLMRVINVKNAPNGKEVVLKTQCTSLKSPKHFTTNGKWTKSSQTEHYEGKNKTFDVQGEVILNSNSPTVMTAFF